VPFSVESEVTNIKHTIFIIVDSVCSHHEYQQKDMTLRYTESLLLQSQLSWLVQIHIHILLYYNIM